MKKVIINIQTAVFSLIAAILLLVLPYANVVSRASGDKDVILYRGTGLKMIGEIMNKNVLSRQVADKPFLLRFALILGILVTLIFLIAHLITAIISAFGKQKRILGILTAAVPTVTCPLGFFLFKFQASSCLRKFFDIGISVRAGTGFIFAAILLIIILLEEIFPVGLLTKSDKRRPKSRGSYGPSNPPVDYGYGPGDAGRPSDGYGYSPKDTGRPSDSYGYGSGDAGRPSGDYGYRRELYTDPAEPVRPSAAPADTVYGDREYGRPEPADGRGSLSILCVSGEYESARFPLKPGETILIGRDQNICNIVLTNPRVSRKHCSISYDAPSDTYTIINYSAQKCSFAWLAICARSSSS